MAGRSRWLHEKRASGRYAPPLWHVWVVAPLFVLAAIATSYLIYQYVYDLLADAANETKPPKPVNVPEAIRSALAVVALIGVALAGVYAYRKQRIAEGDAHRADANQLADRYTTAAEQLGHDKAAVRLAGVYALSRLADDWEEQRQVCIDVLCAYLRMPYETAPTAEGYKEGDREVRDTIIRVIREHLQDSETSASPSSSWSDYNFDFTGATFDSGNLSNSRFKGTVSFEGAEFSGGTVSFEGAEFSGGTVSFDRATFSGGTVTFDRATFSGGTVSFDRAMFSGGTVTFDRATFSGGTVSFYAEFSGGSVSFDSATFSGGTVSFEGAEFSGGIVSFDAEFSGGTVFFDLATFSRGRVSFDAMFSGGIVSFDTARFYGGSVSFHSARFYGGNVRFDGSEFSGGTVRFDLATFSGSAVSFDGATFSGGIVSFDAATFSGGIVFFDRARFSGDTVHFDGSEFSGGTVDLRSVRSWVKPPTFTPGVLDNPPEGLFLPAPTTG